MIFISKFICLQSLFFYSTINVNLCCVLEDIMFYTIIVDDEETIREGLSKYISRAFSEICITGVFSDGKDAIDFLSNNHVDIILTDIRMSEKSGIDIAKYVFENTPDVKVVFLSAYQEFEYAKKAMKYGVKDYLTKPIKLSELDEIMNTFILEFRIEQENLDNATKDNEDLQTLLSIVKRDFYSDILLGILKTPEEITHRANKIRISEDFLSKTQCAIFSFSLSPTEKCYYGSDELHNGLVNLLLEIKSLKSAISLTQGNHENFFIGEFCDFSSCEIFYNSLRNDLGKIANSARELMCVNTDYKILFCGENIFSLLNYHGPENSVFSTSALIEGKIKSLLSGILSQDYQSAEDSLNDLRIYSRKLSINDSKNLMQNLFSKINSVILGDLQNDSISFEDVDNQQELFEKGNEALSTLFEKASITDNIDNPVITKAKKYIFEHLSEDIGLDDIAGHVYLNPVYFSRFFKQHTGQTMTEYLTKARIKIACDMLRSHKYKIHEISRACGYSSSKYFAKIFRQYTGQTPSEYSKTN